MSCKVCDALTNSLDGDWRTFDKYRAHPNFLLNCAALKHQYGALATDFDTMQNAQGLNDLSSHAPSQRLKLDESQDIWRRFFTGQTTIIQLFDKSLTWLVACPEEGYYTKLLARLIQENVFMMLASRNEDAKIGLLFNIHRLPMSATGEVNMDIAKNLIQNSFISAHMWALVNCCLLMVPPMLGQFGTHGKTVKRIQRLSYYCIIEFSYNNKKAHQLVQNLIMKRVFTMSEVEPFFHSWGVAKFDPEYQLKQDFMDEPRLPLWRYSQSGYPQFVIDCDVQQSVPLMNTQDNISFSHKISLDFHQDHLWYVLDWCAHNQIPGFVVNTCSRKSIGAQSFEKMQALDGVITVTANWNSAKPKKLSTQTEEEFRQLYTTTWQQWYKHQHQLSLQTADIVISQLQKGLNKYDCLIGYNFMMNIDLNFDVARKSAIIQHWHSENLVKLLESGVIDQVTFLTGGYSVVTFGRCMDTSVVDPNATDEILTKTLHNFKCFVNHIRQFNLRQKSQKEQLPRHERKNKFPAVKLVCLSKQPDVWSMLLTSGMLIGNDRVVYDCFHASEGSAFQTDMPMRFGGKGLTTTLPTHVMGSLTNCHYFQPGTATADDVKTQLTASILAHLDSCSRTSPPMLPIMQGRSINITTLNQSGFFMVTDDDTAARVLCQEVAKLNVFISGVLVVVEFTSSFWPLTKSIQEKRMGNMLRIEWQDPICAQASASSAAQPGLGGSTASATGATSSASSASSPVPAGWVEF